MGLQLFYISNLIIALFNTSVFYVTEHSNIVSKKEIIYYDVSVHGKGLVDSMSSLGVKGPLRKTVWFEDFNFFCADDITTSLVRKFVYDDTKHHAHLNLCKIRKNRDKKNLIKINGYMQLHVICFSPNGKVTAKVNRCFCDACVEVEKDSI